MGWTSVGRDYLQETDKGRGTFVSGPRSRKFIKRYVGTSTLENNLAASAGLEMVGPFT